MRIWIGVLLTTSLTSLLVGLYSCGSDDPPEPQPPRLTAQADAFDLVIDAKCGCPDHLGYASTEECKSVRHISMAWRTCAEQMAAEYTGLHAEVECNITSFQTLLTCINGASCDAMAISTCEGMQDLAACQMDVELSTKFHEAHRVCTNM